MARTGRTKRDVQAEASGDPKVLRNACAHLGTVTKEVEAAIADVKKSGYDKAEPMETALNRVVRRVSALSKRINPDAAKERERERKVKRIASLEKRLAEMKAELSTD